MRFSPAVTIIVLVLIGFLTGSTAYFYAKSRTTKANADKSIHFDGQVQTVGSSTSAPDKIDSLTKPADPKGRVAYPANTYTLATGEGLFSVGSKMNIPWQTIKLANGLTNENLVQLGTVLVIPKYNTNTDYYRINFIINEDVATELNLTIRDQKTNDNFDPLKVAKTTALTYWNIAASDDWSLLSQDKSQGQALVLDKQATATNVIALVQPKIKGDNGLWALTYIEHREEKNN
ncbi:MAG TPA: LysM domain-containing protein [Candidatus Saccharimonadales bacterium]|nr:LysM domain-containing protein [Candidatus Saccharimonadales bacterium]